MFKDKVGTVKHIYKATLFLHSTTYNKDSGIFPVRSRSCVLLGKEKKSAIDSFAMPPPKAYSSGSDYKKNIHKAVRVVKGAHKGLVGRVLGVREKENIPFYEVELIAKLKKITIEVSKTKLEDEIAQLVTTTSFADDTFNAETPLHASQTPMIGGETPTIYGGDTPRAENDENDPFRASEKDFEAEFAPRRTSRFSAAAPNPVGWGSSNTATTGSTESAGWETIPPIASGGWGGSTSAVDTAGWGNGSTTTVAAPRGGTSTMGWGDGGHATQASSWSPSPAHGSQGWGSNPAIASSSGWGANTSMPPSSWSNPAPASQTSVWGNANATSASATHSAGDSRWSTAQGWGMNQGAPQNAGSRDWSTASTYESSTSPGYSEGGR